MRTVPLILVLVLVLTAFTGCTESDDDSSGRAGVGDYNKKYLRDDDYPNIIIEIDYVEGFQPSSSAVQLLKQRINENCDKSTVTVVQGSFASDDNSYTLKEIKNLEEKHRTKKKDGNTIVVHILYLNGKYSENNNVLGLAYYADAFAVFKERIEDVATTGIDNPFLVSDEDIEEAVIVHEFGHLLGLVNINYESERDHEDPEHKHHCVHEDCVMNAQIESNAISNLINTGGTSNKPPTDFGPDCTADLNKLREG